MKLTRAADYAIRLLTHLSANGGEGTALELAKEIDVPFNHLAKLVPILSRHGYIVTKKGKGGGLKLAKDPKQIDLAELVAAIEGPIVVSDCIFNRQTCRFSGKCQARKCLGKVRQAMVDVLSSTTIYDLVPAK
ncbi:MAG: Rrf2 family transcriptional regulator [bacterium]